MKYNDIIDIEYRVDECCFGLDESIDWECGLPVYYGTDEYKPPAPEWDKDGSN